jgi:hypothetical protein
VGGLWLQDIESLEAISQDEDTRNLFLRMAYLSQNGRLQPFLRELEDDRELDDHTKETLAELACDEAFLHAVEDYVHRTRALH